MDTKEKKKFKIVSLGCRTNQYEGQAFRDQLLERGYFRTEEGEEADLCIVNTCTFTESADSSILHEIRQLAKQNSGSRLVVSGCSVERQPDKIIEVELIQNTPKGFIGRCV